MRRALGKIRDPNYWDETTAISKCDTYEVDISSRPMYATSVLSVNRGRGRKKKENGLVRETLESAVLNG